MILRIEIINNKSQMKIYLCFFIILFTLAQSQWVCLSGNCQEQIINCQYQLAESCLSCSDGYELNQNECRLGQLVPCNEDQRICVAQKFKSFEDFQQFLKQRKQDARLYVNYLSHPPSTSTEPFFDELHSRNYQIPDENVNFDGEYIYSYGAAGLSILRGYPADKASLLSTIRLESGISKLFIRGNLLFAIGVKSFHTGNYNDRSIVTIIDAFNKRNPRIIKEYEILGKYFDSRMNNNGYISLLTKTNVRHSTSIPSFVLSDDRKQQVPIQNLYIYNTDISYPLMNLFTIYRFSTEDFNSGMQASSLIISTFVEVIQLSEQSVYIGYPVNYGNQTAIHKITVNQSGILPSADTKIKGRVHEKFSIDQTENVLRVFTSDIFFDLDTLQALYYEEKPLQFIFGANYLYTLDKDLKELDRITGWGYSQRISNIEFTKNKIYVSTSWKRLDPLYVFDVSNPSNLQLLGEVSIPQNFSSLFYVFSDSIIIGFNRQVRDEPTLAVINIEDLQNPQILSYSAPRSRYANFFSSAKFNRQGLLISKEKNLLLLPAVNKDLSIYGAFVFYIDRNLVEFQENREIYHFPSGQERGCVPCNDYLLQDSFIIEEMIYTKSKCKIEAHRIFKNQHIKTIYLPECR